MQAAPKYITPSTFVRMFRWGIFILLFTSCTPKYFLLKESSVDYTYVHDSLMLKDDEIASFIKPYRMQMDSLMNEVIGYTEAEMLRAKEYVKQHHSPETPIGNFMADLVLAETNDVLRQNGLQLADMCILNVGGVRSSFPKGAITIGHVYEVMPFDNVIVLLELNGEQMEEMFEYLAEKKGQPVSGVRMGIKNGHAIHMHLGNELFNEDKDRIYRVLTSDYLSSGGDDMEFFEDATYMDEYGFLRDMMILHFKKLNQYGKKASAALDGRIYYDK